MRYYLTRANPKVYVVIFGVMILAGLVLCPLSIYRWRDSVRSEAQYRLAPLCASSGQSGCRLEMAAVVKDTHLSVGRTKTTHLVSLSMPNSSLNGNIPISWDTDHRLYDLLKPGDKVTAEEWSGQIVAIRGAGNSLLRTEYDPTYKRQAFIISLIAVPLITILVIFFEYKLVRSMRKLKS